MKFFIYWLRCACILSIAWQTYTLSRCEQSCLEEERCCLPVSNKGTSRTDCSHTDFAGRQLVFNNTYQHNLGLFWWYHDVVCEVPCARMAMQLTPYYQKSRNPTKLARYFLPCCVSGQVAVQENGLGDIGSLWLSLIAAQNEQYEGFFSISPEREVVGNFFDFRISLSPIICNTWFDVTFALERVRHTLNFCTHEGPNPGVACNVSTLQQAFCQPDWQYGKLWQGERTVLGIDDVQFKFGCDWFYCDMDHLSPYLLLGISTHRKACDQYLFAPSIASGQTSFGFGIIGDVEIATCEYTSCTLLTDFKYRHEFGKTFKRTFDLCKNGDWSRYLLVVAQEEPSNTLPGINFMTQDVRVHGTNVIDWWSAFHYKYRQAHIEVGYDLWWHEHETVTLCAFPEGIGIYDLAGQCTGNPTSASNAMINQSIAHNQPTSDATFVPISACDLNLNSGAVPTRMSSTLYIALGYDAYIYERPLLIGCGVAYEFGHRTSALNTINAWGKIGIGF